MLSLCAMFQSMSSSIRICHLADIHLGYRRYNKLTESGHNQREVDVNAAFREAIDRIIRINPDLVIIAGDVFHSVRPSNSVLAFCFRQLSRLESGIKAPIVIVAGNHESPKRIDTGNILRLYKEINRVEVVDTKSERLFFPDISTSILCVPHNALTEVDQVEFRADDRAKYNILCTHAQVNDKWRSDFGGVDLELKSLAPHEWDYIALGHVHLHKEVALNTCYPGSLEFTSTNIWAEADENKGFIEIELPSGQRKFHELTSPREVRSLLPLDATGLSPDEVMQQIVDVLESVPGGVEGKILRLEINNLSREIFRQLDHKELRRWKSKALNITIDHRTPEHAGASKAFISGKKKNMREEFFEFCKEQGELSSTVTDLEKVFSSYWQKTEDLVEVNE